MPTSKTVSTSAAETEQGRHVFHIVWYSQQRGLGRKPIRSGKFSVGGHRWLAFLFPDGAKLANGGEEHRLVAGVALADKNSKAYASYELRLADHSTGLFFPVHRVEWKKRLEWTSHLVLEDSVVAHKMVLATRSPVFKAEFYGPLRETGMEPIVIRNMQPGVFEALVHFIYTDSLPPFDNLGEDGHREMIRHLLVAADRYAMERLKLMCQSILCENLNVQTVAITLALADQHHCDVLKDACIEFMSCSSVMDAVEATQGYKDLKRTCPSVAVETLEKRSRFRKE